MPESEFEFDMQRITAGDIVALEQAHKAIDIDGQAVTLAKACLRCPDGWGKPNEPETFADLDYVDFADAVHAFREAANHAQEGAPSEVAGVAFNFVGVKARKMGKFLKALQTADISTLATMFTQFVKTVPSGWGKLDAAATYLNQPYHTVFLPMARMAVAEANDSEKNRSKRS